MVKLYIADVSSLDIEKHLGEVSEYRREKVLRAQKPDSKRRLLGAELLLNIAVPNHPPYRISGRGKPYFECGNPCFSLSHSGKYVLCAVSDKIIGADIEAPRENSAALAERFFTENEADAVLNAEDPDEEFCRLWVIKESYMKATGEGFACPLNSFEAVDKIGEYRTWHTGLDGYHIAVCTKGDAGEIEINTVTL